MSFKSFKLSEISPVDLLIDEQYMQSKWKDVIPLVSVFDIETLEQTCDVGFEQKLVSIATCSEIDGQSKYWAIESSSEPSRQKIGLNFEFSSITTI